MKKDRNAPLQMEVDEITSMFRQAKNKMKQISILAQINATSQGRIIDILVDHGETVSPALIDQFGWAETKEKYNAAQAAAEAVGAPEPEEEPAADYEQQPQPEQLPAAEETPEPQPMTVGALRDQLFGLPEDAPVRLGGSAPIRSVTFVREFNAAKGQTVSQVMID